MVLKNIEELHPNPNNDRILEKEGKEMLLHSMSMGDTGSFLITADNMIIDGNNRWHLRNEAGWANKEVRCHILTAQQDELGFYPLIDNVIVKEAEVIPHHYISIEAMEKAFSLVRNMEAAYDDPEAIANKWDQWQLPADKFQVHFFPPKNYEETIAALKKSAKEKQSQVVINFQDPESATNAHANLVTQYPNAKLKV